MTATVDQPQPTVNQPERKPFVPKPPVVFHGGNPARGLKATEKASLLKVFNETRKGEKAFVVEVVYEKQTDAAIRTSPDHYQNAPGVDARTHVGLVIKADQGRNGEFYITLADHNRCDAGEIGYTSMRLSGLRKFKRIKEVPGLGIIDII